MPTKQGSIDELLGVNNTQILQFRYEPLPVNRSKRVQLWQPS